MIVLAVVVALVALAGINAWLFDRHAKAAAEESRQLADERKAFYDATSSTVSTLLDSANRMVDAAAKITAPPEPERPATSDEIARSMLATFAPPTDPLDDFDREIANYGDQRVGSLAAGQQLIDDDGNLNNVARTPPNDPVSFGGNGRSAHDGMIPWDQ